jgi:hypothetical protein
LPRGKDPFVVRSTHIKDVTVRIVHIVVYVIF